jgi:membrane-associated phospholipid phosphatase
VIAALILISWYNAPHYAGTFAYLLIALTFTCVIPALVVYCGVRSGYLTNLDMTRRKQRNGPLVITLVSLIVGLAILFINAAPGDLVALVATAIAELFTLWLVNLLWKVSLHTMALTGIITILTILFGTSLLCLVPLVMLASWVRVKLGVHTYGQTMAGMVLGSTIAVVVFPLMR